MKSIFKTQFIVAFVLGALFLTSCDNDKANDVLRGGNDETNYNLRVTNDNADKKLERNLVIRAVPKSLVKVNTYFKGEKNMYRLYITKNILSKIGNKPEIYDYPVGSKKKDGSIDLPRQDKKEFEYGFSFEAPKSNNEIVQYKLWVTTSRGDKSEPSDSNAISKDPAAYGTITIIGDKNALSDVNSVKSFKSVLLAAPLADRKSKTFLSLKDGLTYEIADAKEMIKIWDLGYYYGSKGKASLASVSNYLKEAFDVEAAVGADYVSLLNKCYFKKSTTFTKENFDAISSNNDLNSIIKSSSQRINNLVVGDIIEFVDNYGNKGLIKVLRIVPGAGTGGQIELDIKLQSKVEAVKL